MSSVELGRRVSTVSARCARMGGNRTNRRHRVSLVPLGTLVVREPALRVDQVNVLWMIGLHAPHALFKPTARRVQTAYCARTELSLIWDGLAALRVASVSIRRTVANARFVHLVSSQLLSATDAPNV